MSDNLKSFKEINKKLEQDFLCLPPYNSVNGGLLDDILKDLDSGKEIKYHITKEIIFPWRRAYQMVYRYRELNIFKTVMQVIEFATLSFYKGNFICSYLSLLPIIETIMRNWAEENPDLKFKDIKNYTSGISKRIKLQFSEDILYNNWLHTYRDYFERIIREVLFVTDVVYKNKKFGDIFNRHITLHSLENIDDAKNNSLNNIRLFLIIDVIAELYLASNWDKYPKLHSIFDLSYNPDLYELYFTFYKSCSLHGLESSHENIINNVFLKTLSKKEIDNAKRSIKFLDKVLNITKAFPYRKEKTKKE